MKIFNDKEIDARSAEEAFTIPAKVESLGHVAQKLSRDVGREIGAAANNVSERAVGYVKSTRSYVEKNPLQSVAIATATGLAVGALLSMTRRRSSK